jgi:hypothetical protein
MAVIEQVQMKIYQHLMTVSPSARCEMTGEEDTYGEPLNEQVRKRDNR